MRPPHRNSVQRLRAEYLVAFHTPARAAAMLQLESRAKGLDSSQQRAMRRAAATLVDPATVIRGQPK